VKYSKAGIDRSRFHKLHLSVPGDTALSMTTPAASTGLSAAKAGSDDAILARFGDV
jgi:hypothetical protein